MTMMMMTAKMTIEMMMPMMASLVVASAFGQAKGRERASACSIDSGKGIESVRGLHAVSELATGLFGA